jgi:hypothetical protein
MKSHVYDDSENQQRQDKKQKSKMEKDCKPLETSSVENSSITDQQESLAPVEEPRRKKEPSPLLDIFTKIKTQHNLKERR